MCNLFLESKLLLPVLLPVLLPHQEGRINKNCKMDDASKILEKIKGMNDCIITLFPTRKEIHENFCDSCNEARSLNIISRILSKLDSIFEEEHSMHRMNNSFFLHCLPKLIRELLDDQEKYCIDSWYAVMSIYGHLIFAEYCTYKKKDLTKPASNETSQPQVANDSPSYTVDAPNEEVHRSVITFGGGCMALVWRINKKRITGKSGHLSIEQMRTSRLLRKIALQLREPDITLLPASLIMRNRGGMFFPSHHLFEFLHAFERENQHTLKEASILKNGRRLIKIYMKNLHSNEVLRNKFIDGCHKIQAIFEAQHPDEDLCVFYKEWLNKLGHARFNEFWSGRCKLLSTGLSKGGQSLRDNIYTFASMTGKTKKPNKKQAKETDKGLKAACTSTVPSTSNTSDAALTIQKPKCRRRLLDDGCSTSKYIPNQEVVSMPTDIATKAVEEHVSVVVRPQRKRKTVQHEDFIYE